MAANKELMAPGHVFQPDLGTGIEWFPNTAKLWSGGQVLAEAEHNAKSAYDFWYNLAFADEFPFVTHWWFRSAWTQRVRVSRVQGHIDSDTTFGHIQFIDGEQDGQVWTVSVLGGVADIDVPLPPLETQAINFPLRIALGNLILQTILGEKEPNQWRFVTSLVEREHLAAAFPTELDGMGWRLHNVRMTLRHALCNLQGMFPEAVS